MGIEGTILNCGSCLRTRNSLSQQPGSSDITTRFKTMVPDVGQPPLMDWQPLTYCQQWRRIGATRYGSDHRSMHHKQRDLKETHAVAALPPLPALATDRGYCCMGRGESNKGLKMLHVKATRSEGELVMVVVRRRNYSQQACKISRHS